MAGEGMPPPQIILPGLETFLILLSVLSSGIANVKADIRCYCNLPICVATGYMCKSTIGTCFSEYFGYSTDLSKSRHGCMEMYSRNQKELCQPHHRTKNSAKGRVAHVCCNEDMCNYVKNVDLNVRLYRINQTLSSVFSPTEEKSLLYYPTAHEAALQQHIWFKAAVIAVPIAGSFILVILVVIALKMLRKDSKRQRQMQEIRRQRQFKTYLLFARSRLLLDKKNSDSKPGDIDNPSVYKTASATVSPSCDSMGSKDKYFVYDL